jgi:hypothetical protein
MAAGAAISMTMQMTNAATIPLGRISGLPTIDCRRPCL